MQRRIFLKMGCLLAWTLVALVPAPASGQGMLESYFYKKPQKESTVVVSALTGLSFQKSVFANPVFEPNSLAAGVRVEAYMNASWSNSMQILAGSGQRVLEDDVSESIFLHTDYAIHKVVSAGRFHLSLGPSLGFYYFFDDKDFSKSNIVKSQVSVGFGLDAGFALSDRLRIQILLNYYRGVVDSSIEQQHVLVGIGWML